MLGASTPEIVEIIEIFMAGPANQSVVQHAHRFQQHRSLLERVNVVHFAHHRLPKRYRNQGRLTLAVPLLIRHKNGPKEVVSSTKKESTPLYRNGFGASPDPP